MHMYRAFFLGEIYKHQYRLIIHHIHIFYMFSLHRYPPLFPKLRRWLFENPLHTQLFIPVTFKAWKDAELEQKYSGDLTAYEIELSARREQISYPPGIIDFHVHYDKKNASTKKATLVVSCLPNVLARNAIQQFLDEAGLIVE